MIIKRLSATQHTSLVLIMAAFISAGVFLLNRKSKHTVYKSRVFNTPGGWGYDILVNDKLFIRQESIPVLNGHEGFKQQSEAEQTAELIINKMERGQRPTVTKFEIQNICSLNPTENDPPGKQ